MPDSTPFHGSDVSILFVVQPFWTREHCEQIQGMDGIMTRYAGRYRQPLVDNQPMPAWIESGDRSTIFG
jgi:hypothetical protein